MHTPDDLNNIDFGMSFGNFNPEDIQVDETINAVFVVDVSPSIVSYEKELNFAFSDFIESMKRSHLADKLFVSVLDFHHQVNVKSGFQPLDKVIVPNFVASGGGTALYDATLKALQMAVDYRNTLMTSGVDTKTLVFIITDGMDNSSQNPASSVKKVLNGILSNESNAFSFNTILFGVGPDKSFEKAKEDMGIQYIARVGQNGDEIRKMIGMISRSISGAASGQNLSF